MTYLLLLQADLTCTVFVFKWALKNADVKYKFLLRSKQRKRQPRLCVRILGNGKRSVGCIVINLLVVAFVYFPLGVTANNVVS